LNLKQLNQSAIYGKILDPSSQIPLSLTGGWVQDYADAYTFFLLTMYGPSIQAQGNYNNSMVGATPAQMKQYGYSITSVPGMDSQINSCVGKTGDDRINCWANDDKYLMEQVVPVVPLTVNNVVGITAARVTNFTYSSFASQPNYSQLAVNGGSSSSS